MRMLAFHKSKGWIVRQSVSSFAVYDFQALPAAFGIEYRMPDGVLWTFSDKHLDSESDFFTGLKRSGLLTNQPQVHFGTMSVFCVPFFTKGVPEVLPDVSRILISSDADKYLYAAAFSPAYIDSAVCSDSNFYGKLRDITAV